MFAKDAAWGGKSDRDRYVFDPEASLSASRVTSVQFICAPILRPLLADLSNYNFGSASPKFSVNLQ